MTTTLPAPCIIPMATPIEFSNILVKPLFRRTWRAVALVSTTQGVVVGQQTVMLDGELVQNYLVAVDWRKLPVVVHPDHASAVHPAINISGDAR